MVIDSHQHFWKYHPQKYAWITEQMEILRQDFLPPDLGPLLKSEGIDGCVAVQANMSEAETDFLLNLAGEYPFVKGVVGWLDLMDKRLAQRLEKYAPNPLLKGIRHIVQDEIDDHFMLRPDFQAGIGQLGKYGLTYDILVYPRQLPAAIKLARKYPNQAFVLDHIGKPAISEAMQTAWRQQVNELAKCPNVCCKLSGMVTETRDFQWQKHDFTPYIDVVLEAFGANRLMFGSDWPVCLLAGNYQAVKDIVLSYIHSLSDGEQAQIMGKNASDFYRLKVS